MSDALVFDRDFDPAYGAAVEVAPLVRRITARNPGPFTFAGTNTFLVGRRTLAVIDPGPDDPAHLAAILAAADGGRITQIVLTHTHRDHTGAIPALARATGAEIVGCAPAAPAEGGLDAAHDRSYAPARVLGARDVLDGPDWQLEAVPTPGHARNHLCFALRGPGILFSGDHVMGWSTSVVAPPDGDMAAYRASLRLLLERPEDHYLPAHGPAIAAGRAYVRRLLAHRAAREAAIIEALTEAPRSIPELVAALYPGLDARLAPAAGLSVQAHLIELERAGRIAPAAGTAGQPRFGLSPR